MSWYQILWIVCTFAARSELADGIFCMSRERRCLMSTTLKAASIASTSLLLMSSSVRKQAPPLLYERQDLYDLRSLRGIELSSETSLVGPSHGPRGNRALLHWGRCSGRDAELARCFWLLERNERQVRAQALSALTRASRSSSSGSISDKWSMISCGTRIAAAGGGGSWVAGCDLLLTLWLKSDQAEDVGNGHLEHAFQKFKLYHFFYYSSQSSK
ncbi:hypothetical protein C8J57DRAFT_1222481 [Mycena rebaudengoi]|nr:hypothetical protein C8J57DRAFT_1222481 [Mycena rebaudengoi]